MSQEVTTSTSQATAAISSSQQNQLSVKISEANLVEIVERASTIDDRLSEDFISKRSGKEPQIIDSRLEQWCQVVAKGDRKKFLKRLNWDDLDSDSVRLVLGDVNLADRQSLPSWTDTLQKAMEIAGAISENIFISSKSQKYQYLDVETPLPFEEIYLPFVEVAREKLKAKINSDCNLVSDTAYWQLQFSLLKQLNNLFARTLNLEFSLFRAYKGSQLVRLISQLQNNSSRQLYEEFVENLLQDGLLAFFQEYSVLGKLAAIATDFWVETTAEFIDRLASDWNRISQTFSEKEELGQIVAIQTGLSDLHNCGHSVLIVQFTSDLKLVYKPKNLSLEQAYFSFLNWINRQDVILPLKTLKIVNCSTHGWIEFVETLPCENKEAVKRYYQRAGNILCLIYALKGTDCHKENLIACGEQPVLIDLETLLHHQTWTSKENTEAIAIANEKLWNSVGATALLPGVNIMHLGKTQGKGVDFSGLGNDNLELSVRSLKWKNINTDNMAIVEEEIALSPEKNQPFGENLDTCLSNHTEELIVGFREMYGFLKKRQELLLASNSPLATFARQKVRLVLRNTQLYTSILQNSLNPKFLRNGVERSIELDILSRGLLSSETKPDSWVMIAAERQALEQLDIPYITAYSNGDAITINSEVTIGGFLDNPSYEDVITRIQELNNDNLVEQIGIIKASLYSYFSEPEQVCVTKTDAITPLEIRPFNQENILQQAIDIATELEQKAIKGDRNSAAWLGMTYNSSGQKFQLRPLGYSLYDGHCGIALFLAALANITDDRKYANLALGSLYSLRQIISKEDNELQTKLINNIGIGGATGLASIVYAFVCIAKLLDEPKLIEEAQKIATWMQIEAVDVQPKLGILDGVAGTVLSLLSLYKITNHSKTLEQAIAWGKYLLDHREHIDTDNKIWLNSSGEVLTGFAEGIAGISHALLSLYAVNQETVFLTAAIKAIACEQNYLSQTNGYHNAKTFYSFTSWCDGLSGIALARLGSLDILDANSIRQELETILSISNIQRSPISSLDNICGGNFAELEALLLAADKFSDSQYLEIAEVKIAQILSRKEHLKAFQILPSLPHEVFIPSFGVGTAGIGYGLLRYLYPKILPSILLWQ